MATQVNTVENILKSLNGAGKSHPWMILSDSYVLTAVNVVSAANINENGQGLILKAFINTTSGEVKLFLAKWLDTNESRILP